MYALEESKHTPSYFLWEEAGGCDHITFGSPLILCHRL